MSSHLYLSQRSLRPRHMFRIQLLFSEIVSFSMVGTYRTLDKLESRYKRIHLTLLDYLQKLQSVQGAHLTQSESTKAPMCRAPRISNAQIRYSLLGQSMTLALDTTTGKSEFPPMIS